MNTYDYRAEVKNDVKDWILNNIGWIPTEIFQGDRDELADWLNENLWTDDSVTGNGSGSYTFSTFDAEEYICHNLDLLAEACEEFGGNMDVLKDGAEACDVTIRCYLLGGAISEVIEELENEGFFDVEEA